MTDLVPVEYLTLEAGDPIYNAHKEYIGKVVSVSDLVQVEYGHSSSLLFTIGEIESFYTPIKNFYSSPTEKQHEHQESTQKQALPTKILTNEEIYGILLSNVSLLGVSKKAVRKIEKAIIKKLSERGIMQNITLRSFNICGKEYSVSVDVTSLRGTYYNAEDGRGHTFLLEAFVQNPDEYGRGPLSYKVVSYEKPTPLPSEVVGILESNGVVVCNSFKEDK